MRYDATGLKPSDRERKPVTYPAEPWGGVHQQAPYDTLVVNSEAQKVGLLPPAKAGGKGVGTFLGPAEEWHNEHIATKRKPGPPPPSMLTKGPQNGADEGFGIPY